MASAGLVASERDASPVGDPFVTAPSGPTRLRYSAFDSNIFALGLATSPEQAKRAIEAHLADTQQRMEEAGKLGTTLLHQRKELTERLKEVEQLQSEEAELTPELNRKLAELESEYMQVARESARAFIPKQRVPSNEDPAGASGSPFAHQGKGGRRSVSPSKFESQASGSPTKLSVPNRKQRNQPANRIHDIEFAAEISSSLISQVRHLQALLAEREEELKDTKSKNSRLDIEFESFQQRMKTLDESEHRYKDENWNLETQIHELIAAQKEAADREKKLTQALNALQADKNATQRELDEVRLNLSKLDEKHTAAVKQHDIELGTAKRKEILADSERSALQRKIEDLTNQNQEIAKAFSLQRGRALEREAALGMSDEDFETGHEAVTPEHSPPPSPVKGTPRHSVLESETLKTSLHHAQRTIQSLRTNVHREKTEKLELRRMLQDLRDELEKARGDPNASNRRSRKVDSREFKKPLKPGQLGASRSSRSEAFFDDPEWEDGADNGSPRPPAIRSPTAALAGSRGSALLIPPIAESSSEQQFETAAETSDPSFETAAEVSDAAFETAAEDAAFETAHGGTETEDFHTGAEEFSDEDDAATETEASPSKGSGRIRRPPVLPYGHTSRYSFESTASTSNDDEDDYTFAPELKTPTAVPAQKLRLRVSRGGFNLAHRRSRLASEEPALQSSPASFATGSASGTPQAPGQSLFAELGELDGSDDESYVGGVTPSRRSTRSMTPASRGGWTASPPPEMPALPKVISVDSGTMTDPVAFAPLIVTPEPDSEPLALSKSLMVDTGVMTDDGDEPELPVLSPQSVVFLERPTSMGSVIGPTKSDASTQWLGDEWHDEDHSRPLSSFSYSDSGAQHDTEMVDKLSQFPSPPTSPLKLGQVAIPILAPPQELAASSIQTEHIEPQAAPQPRPLSPPILGLSSTVFEHVEPVSPQVDEPATLDLGVSSVLVSLDDQPVVVEPVVPEPEPISVAEVRAEEIPPQPDHVERDILPVMSPVSLSMVSAQAEEIHPQEEPKPPIATLSQADILVQDVEPLSPATVSPTLELSAVQTLDTEPIEPVPDVVPLDFASVQYVESEPISPRGPKRDGFIIPRDKEDILAKEPPRTPPHAIFGSVLNRKGKGKVDQESPVIAEDETRQSLNASPVSETPESQRPLKEMSGNTDARPGRKQPVSTSDSGAQTALTADAIDHMLKVMQPRSQEETDPFFTDFDAGKSRPSQVFDTVVRAKGRAIDSRSSSRDKRHDTPLATARRPGSAASNHDPSPLPPLPPNHREVIEAARLGSSGSGRGSVVSPPLGSPTSLKGHSPLGSSGGSQGAAAAGQVTATLMGPPPLPPMKQAQGTDVARLGSSGSGQGTKTSMGPPPLPAAVQYRNRNYRPETPKQSTGSIASGRGTPTPRAGRYNSNYGAADVYPPPSRGNTQLSHKSSVSSFVSELDDRFNIHDEMAIGAGGMFGSRPPTDPRMIRAITQVMIGEYLWKYTRKTGRGEISENRHRRYFWLHPYNRTLHWSERDPGTAGRAEHKAKSVPIQAVRMVADNNPMPPGLHNKSLLVISGGRTIKFTATTGQRHETWFNALSFILKKPAEDEEVEDTTDSITRDDVAEFNPSFHQRPANGTRAPTAPSLTSYNSRSARVESPGIDLSMSIPTLTPQARPNLSQSRLSTLGKISGYWGSLRSRSASRRPSLYDANETQDDVNDSAEDLRAMIEQQDRESDRLENVRACCDGRHDVGTLGMSPQKGRHSHSHPHTPTHGRQSVTPTPLGSVRSRA